MYQNTFGKEFFRQNNAGGQSRDRVSFSIRRGETFGLVGESGCGKSTLGRTLIRMYEPTSGTITFDGTDISTLMGKELLKYHKRMQIIFQIPILLWILIRM